MPSTKPAPVTDLQPEEFFRDSDLLNSLAVGVYVCDLDGHIKKI